MAEELELQHDGLLVHKNHMLLLLCPLLVFLQIVVTVMATKLSRASTEQLLSKLPSPPRRLPIIGHLHLLGPLPHVSLRDLADEHGRAGLMLLRLGAVPTLVVSSPAAAEAVLRTHDHVFQVDIMLNINPYIGC